MRSIPDALSATQSPSRRDAHTLSPSQRAAISRMRRAVIAALLPAGLALGLAAAPSLARPASAPPAHSAHAAVSVSHSATAAITPFWGCRGTPAPC